MTGKHKTNASNQVNKFFSHKDLTDAARNRIEGQASSSLGINGVRFRSGKGNPGKTMPSVFRVVTTVEGDFSVKIDPRSASPIVITRGTSSPISGSVDGAGTSSDYVFERGDLWIDAELEIDGKTVSSTSNTNPNYGGVRVYALTGSTSFQTPFEFACIAPGNGVFSIYYFNSTGNIANTDTFPMGSTVTSGIMNIPASTVGMSFNVSSTGTQGVPLGSYALRIEDVVATPLNEESFARTKILNMDYELERVSAYNILCSSTAATLVNSGSIAGAIRGAQSTREIHELYTLVSSLSTGAFVTPSKTGIFAAVMSQTIDDLTFTRKGNPEGLKSENNLVVVTSGNEETAPMTITIEITYELYGQSSELYWTLPPSIEFDLLVDFYTSMGGVFLSENPKHLDNAVKAIKKFSKDPKTRAAAGMLVNTVKQYGPALAAKVIPLLLAAV